MKESYDYFLLGSDYGNLRVRYFYGFLESNLNQINRYITGKGIEYSNKKFIFTRSAARPLALNSAELAQQKQS